MPIRDILLDDNGERVLAANDYAFATGKQATKQGIACAVRLHAGDVWYDLDLGVRYVQLLLLKSTPRVVAQAEIGRAIASVVDVIAVRPVGFDLDERTRRATVSYEADSSEGAVSGAVST